MLTKLPQKNAKIMLSIFSQRIKIRQKDTQASIPVFPTGMTQRKIPKDQLQAPLRWTCMSL